MLIRVSGTTRPTGNTPARNFTVRIEAANHFDAVAVARSALGENGIAEDDIFVLRVRPASGSSVRISQPRKPKSVKTNAAKPTAAPGKPIPPAVVPVAAKK